MNFTAAANESFQILRSYDYEVLIFDDEGNQAFEPEDGRRFFAQPENLLVSITESGEDSAVRLYLSKSTEIGSVMGLLSALRSMATKYKMVFHVRKYERDLAPKDFATQASVSEGHNNNKKEVSTMNLVEGMYGTSRSSYLKLENARMIVRHSAKINENVLGARGRNIDAIYIENAVGERHLFATTQLAPARAMVHHIDNGGSWADSVGEQISRMACDFAACGSTSRHIGFYGNDLTESAQEVRATLREHLREMRRAFESFGRKTRYVEMCEHFQTMAAAPLTEGADETRIAELASLLNTDAVQLSEGVLGTVARVLEAAPDYGPKLAKEQPLDPKSAEVAHVLGKPVKKDAWEAFKKGTLDLMTQPEIEDLRFADDEARKNYLFQQVAKCTRDNSLANVLSEIASRLVDGHGTPKSRASLRAARDQALRIVGLDAAKPGIEEVAAGSEALQEYNDWLGGFAVSKVMEYDRFPLPDHSTEDHNERTLAAIVDNFDYHHFMTSSSARDFHYDARAELDLEEREIDFDAIVAAIEHFLEGELEHQDVVGMHVRAEAERLADDVVTHMTDDGYSVVGAPIEPVSHHDLPMAAEEIDLDADLGAEALVDENCGLCDGDDVPAGMEEDVLLPKGEENDLLGDVTKATVVDPASGEETLPDDAYIARLMALAGRH